MFLPADCAEKQTTTLKMYPRKPRKSGEYRDDTEMREKRDKFSRRRSDQLTGAGEQGRMTMTSMVGVSDNGHVNSKFEVDELPDGACISPHKVGPSRQNSGENESTTVKEVEVRFCVDFHFLILLS